MRFINQILEKISFWYKKYDRPLSSLSLIGGFVFDALTLKRVDSLWENFWVAGHLFIVAVTIILLNLDEEKRNNGEGEAEGHFWLVNILQFFFGGLLSTYIVFYFRSSTLTNTWPFILILIIAFIANERLKKHYERLVFQTSLFFLSLFAFSIFAVPVFLHQIGSKIFVLSGVISMLVMFLFLLILRYVSKTSFIKERVRLRSVIWGIFIVFNVLYFTNLIPPLPLSLKTSGVYHSIVKDAQGNYEVSYEDYGWKGFFYMYDDFHLDNANNPVYVYSAVFSPSNLDIQIIHNWEHYDETSKAWVSMNKVYLPVVGGRAEGFRTYSLGSGLDAGKWRVDVETENGNIIGRINFNLVYNSTATLSKKINY
ncbi:MAG: DUF2914 domain-containing protein [Minisyncoccia bacterium]